MRKPVLIALLIVLAVFSASSATYAALCGSYAPGWNCYTDVKRVGTTTTCNVSVVSPGGSYTIVMSGDGPSDKALHIGTTYYGSSGANSCYGSTCSLKFTYTGSAQPTMCDWSFEYR